MDELNRETTRPVNPRRRKRNKIQIFKEVYLPAVIAFAALLLIFIFLIGSIVRAVQRNQYNKQRSQEASIAALEEQERLSDEAAAILANATAKAKHLDYAGAIEALEHFSGDLEQFPALQERFKQYTDAQNNLVLWNDPNKVLNLSLQVLIADSQRAFTDPSYGTSYNQNFITKNEFSKLLQQLYENGYVLVKLTDVFSEDGAKGIYLPKGKKPLILTQTNVNYYTYMIDGDGDKLPDKDGSGFASKLILDANGNITCEMVDADGKTVTGAFDLVPILDSFVETHPDFSYKGAKAILAVSGYDGIFGYRTNPAAEEYFGTVYHNQEVDGAMQVVEKLRQSGYELACYTYENEPYGDYTVEQIKSELAKWDAEITPILGATDIFVFSRNSDIGEAASPYSGEKFAALKSAGYKYYLGFCADGQAWYYSNSDYIRQGRILITGSNLVAHSEWFNGIFDPSTILDFNR